MKKYLLIILMVISLFTITGCGPTTENNNGKKINGTENQENKLIINGYDLTLNAESSFSKIKFKYPSYAEISNPITSLIINYYKKASTDSLFRVVMGDMYGTNIDESMAGFTKAGTKTINGIEWTIYTKDGRNNYGFNIDYSNIVITFIYDDPELVKFEEEFMKNVSLAK